jgi:serine/threonine protein kinase
VTPERWAQIEELFHRAADCDIEHRTSLLDAACRRDPELRREVETLLTSDQAARDYVHAAICSEFDVVGFPLTGQIVSHYRILAGIGGGGMGFVYRAEDIKLGRRVALKFLTQDSAKDPLALGRFEREARAASALEHPNICPIYEFGEHEGQSFLVMQLLEGQTMQQLLSVAGAAGLPLELPRLVNLAIQVAAGLEAAHRQGIVHRDIKPANIFVTSDGQAKILDFGLAKLVHGDGSEWDRLADAETTVTARAPVRDLNLSRTGMAMGTVGYMSPEQVHGEKLDVRTDLFSFGLVLYEMATGKHAFTGDTWPALQEAILRQTHSPARKLNPAIPIKLEQIIKKALEKNREARYQSASELLADLKSLQPQISPKQLPLGAVATAAVILLLITSVAFWFAKSRWSSSQSPPDLKLRQLTTSSAEIPVKTGAISPDAKYLAYADVKGMHIKLLETGETKAVPAPAGIGNGKVDWEIIATGWFPDSTRFLVNSHPAVEDPTRWSSRTSSIWVVSVLGRAPSKLRDNAVAWSVSPDDSSISFGTNLGKQGEREIWLMSPNGEQSRKLFEAEADGSICCLTFLGSGERVSYVASDKSGDNLLVRDLKGGPVATLLESAEFKKMGDGVLLPDNRLIYSEPCNGVIMGPDQPCNFWIMRVDVRSGGTLDRAKKLTNWVGVWMNEPSATADGKRVAFLQSSGRGIGYLADLDPGGKRLLNSRRFTFEEGGEDTISDWTADGKSVIIIANRGDHYSLYKQSLNSDTQEPVSSAAGGLLENAKVSPDGKWVIIQVWPVRGKTNEARLMRVPITGGVPELIFPVREGSASFCARSPSTICAVAEQTEDRKQMIITSFDAVKGRGPELARFDLDPDYDTNVNNLLWSISPDGSHIAASSGPADPIQIRSLRGQRSQVIRVKDLDHMRLIVWAPDGNGVFVSAGEKREAKILHVDLRGNADVLWNCSSDRCFGAPSPDGRHLWVYEWRVNANMWMMENF